MIEGGITEVVLKGEGAEQFGVRAHARPGARRTALAAGDAGAATAADQRRPGVRITDTALEEIGTASGRFRLVVFLQTWHVYASLGLDNLGSSSVGPWQSYATAAFNSY